MRFQFTNPEYLWLLAPAVAWVLWLAWKTDVQIGAWRRWLACLLRLLVVLLLVLGMAGFQWLEPREGMNVMFLLDRSDSIPFAQQEAARKYVNQAARDRKKQDRTGLLVFGADAALENTPDEKLDLNNTKILAVVGSERTDIAGAIRLGTAAFPEHGQKRMVLASDGNENLGDALAAVMAARPLGVTVDVLPLGIERGNDVSLQKFSLPARAKNGQPFESRIFINADTARSATLRLYRNEQYLGEQTVTLDAEKSFYPAANPGPGWILQLQRRGGGG